MPKLSLYTRKEIIIYLITTDLYPCYQWYQNFWKIVFKQTYEYFFTNKLLYSSQYGCRKGHSTDLASVELVDRVSEYLDGGKLPISVFLDLSKAFDTLNHSILLDKLKYYGFFNTPLNWFASYLQNRMQFVDFDGTLSNTVLMTTGVPQGSILGPLPFIIYMNDIREASENFKSILYADDANLLCPLCSFNTSTSLKDIQREQLSENMNKLHDNILEWLNTNKLSLNVKKTKFMIFHYRQRKIDNLIPNLKTNSEQIERVTEFNFLGLTIDEHLDWSPDIQKVSNKISRTLGIMNRLKRFLPTNILRLIYNSLILPYFQYSILTRGFKVGRLEKLQKRAVRIITNSSYNAHTDPLFKKVNLRKETYFNSILWSYIMNLEKKKIFLSIQWICLRTPMRPLSMITTCEPEWYLGKRYHKNL